MNKKKLIALGVILAAAIAAITLVNTQKGKSTDGEIKLGVAAALSGPVSFWAESVLQGMQMAVEEHNKADPNQQARVIFEDNAGKADSQIAAMRKLCTSDKVACVVSVLTPYSKPLRPLAKQFNTPLLATVTAALDFGAENEWSFRDYPTADQLAARMAKYAYNDIKLRRAVALVVNDEYGTDCLKIFRQTFEEIGGTFLGSDTVTQTDTDMRAQVTKLIQTNPDTAFLVIRENALGTAVRQFRELGFKGQILGINAFDSPVVWQASGPHGEGVLFANARIDYENNAAAASFQKAFRERYGRDPMHTHAYGYSIAQYLLPLAAQAKGDGEKMRELLASMKAGSIRGEIEMLPSRDVLTGVAIYKRTGDQNIIIKE